MRVLLVFLTNSRRFRDHGQPVYIELFVQVEAEKIGSGLKFDGRIQKVPQTRHPTVYCNFGE